VQFREAYGGHGNDSHVEGVTQRPTTLNGSIPQCTKTQQACIKTATKNNNPQPLFIVNNNLRILDVLGAIAILAQVVYYKSFVSWSGHGMVDPLKKVRGFYTPDYTHRRQVFFV